MILDVGADSHRDWTKSTTSSSIYAEAHGIAEKWLALTELPLAEVALSRNGLHQPLSGGWSRRVAHRTDRRAAGLLAAQLAAKWEGRCVTKLSTFR
jgi:hypothetical protein